MKKDCTCFVGFVAGKPSNNDRAAKKRKGSFPAKALAVDRSIITSSDGASL